MNDLSGLRAIPIEVATMQTSRGRLIFAFISNALLIVVPYSWLGHLSLWQAIGWHSAPSIGLTRAYWLLIHGQPIPAWHRNWLIYVFITIAWPLVVHDGYVIIKERLQKG